MKVAIWLMMTFTHGGYWVTGPEFKVESECRAAARIVDIASDAPSRGLAKCVKIEKTL